MATTRDQGVENKVREFYERTIRPRAPNRGGPPSGNNLADGADWERLTVREREEVIDLYHGEPDH